MVDVYGDNFENIVTLLELPNTFLSLEKKCYELLEGPFRFPEMLSGYSKEKASLIKQEKYLELPRPLSAGLLTDDFAARNCSFIRQAGAFRKLAKEAPLETRPILLFYSAVQLYAFLMDSLLCFENRKKHHGLYMERGSSLDSIECRISCAGFFQRLADTYALLGCVTPYSPLVPVYGTSGFKVTSSELSYEKTPKMKLRDITNAFESESKVGHVPSADLISYLILFMASNLARYYPDAWFRISAGIETDLLYYFGEAFRNYELLFQRVVCAFRALTLGSQPSRYLEQDNQIMRSQAGQFSFIADDHLWG